MFFDELTWEMALDVVVALAQEHWREAAGGAATLTLKALWPWLKPVVMAPWIATRAAGRLVSRPFRKAPPVPLPEPGPVATEILALLADDDQPTWDEKHRQLKFVGLAVVFPKDGSMPVIQFEGDKKNLLDRLTSLDRQRVVEVVTDAMLAYNRREQAADEALVLEQLKLARLKKQATMPVAGTLTGQAEVPVMATGGNVPPILACSGWQAVPASLSPTNARGR